MLHSIAFIRSVHTAIFVFFNVVMAVLLYEVIVDKISILTWIAVVLFAIEGIALIAVFGSANLSRRQRVCVE
jgi:ABC-type multidrug transport system permease subunit